MPILLHSVSLHRQHPALPMAGASPVRKQRGICRVVDLKWFPLAALPKPEQCRDTNILIPGAVYIHYTHNL